jgi:hypothetical protein
LRAARARTLESQAELIDAVIGAGDVDGAAVEAAFDPRDLVVYGPVAAFWKRLRESLPWESETKPHQQLVAWILRTMLADRSEDGTARKPVLSSWDVRTSIDSRTWQTRMPADVRAAVDEARLQAEKRSPREPFLARHELEIATPEVITANIPLRDLQRIFAHAEKLLGFAGSVIEPANEEPRVIHLPPSIEETQPPAEFVVEEPSGSVEIEIPS